MEDGWCLKGLEEGKSWYLLFKADIGELRELHTIKLSFSNPKDLIKTNIKQFINS